MAIDTIPEPDAMTIGAKLMMTIRYASQWEPDFITALVGNNGVNRLTTFSMMTDMHLHFVVVERIGDDAWRVLTREKEVLGVSIVDIELVVQVRPAPIFMCEKFQAAIMSFQTWSLRQR